MTSTQSLLDAAIEYYGRGWRPIELPYGQKRPAREGWVKTQYDLDDIRRVFGNGHYHNVGVLTGDVSGKLIDIDIDSPEARRIANLLPSTEAIFGRESSPTAHRLYILTDETSPNTHKFAFAKESFVEIRGNGGQTLFPPSRHPEGEDIRWYKRGVPSEVSYARLERSVSVLASAALLARHWPEGVRHEAAGALAGGLARSGWTQPNVEAFVRAVAIASGDEEARDREAFVVDTFASVAHGTATTGWPKLSELVGLEIVEAVRHWLRLSDIGDRFHLTDLGNAERLVKKHGEDIRYSDRLKTWFIWDGKRWKEDEITEVFELARDTVRDIPDEAKGLDDDTRKKIFSHALRSEDQRRIVAMVDVASKAIHSIKVHPDDLDNDVWLFNVQNGTVDLRTGNLRPHNRNDHLNKITPVRFDADAKCPLFEGFIRHAFKDNADMIRYVQKAIGYTLTGVVTEKALFICYGPTDTGKSTLLADVVQRLMGMYAIQVREETISMQRQEQIPVDIAELKGKRYAVVSEPRDSMRLNEARIKAMTGRNRLKGRFLYAQPFEFDVTHKLWIDTNFPPLMSNRDDAVWRRVKLLPFEAGVQRSAQDPNLGEKLRGELPGILNWAIEGCLLWQREGLFEPEVVIMATQEYREEMDTLKEYLDERCELGSEFYVGRAEFRQDYLSWCEDNAVEPIKSGGARSLWSKELARHNITKAVRARTAIWLGVRMKREG